MHFRLIGRILRQELFVRRPAIAIMRIGWIVAKFGVLDQMPDDIDAKTIDAPAKPETHRLIYRSAHFRIAPVQIRLLGKEGVIVILPGGSVVFPAAAAEFRQPVVRRSAIRSAVAPDVPVAPGINARTAAFNKP